MTIQNQPNRAGTAPLKVGAVPAAAPVAPDAAAAAAAPAARAADANTVRATVDLEAPGVMPTFDTGFLARQAVLNMVPGASLKGNWSQAQLGQLIGALEKLPPAFRAKLAGTQFEVGTGAAPLPGDALAYARNTPKSITFSPEGLKLEQKPGVSGFEELALHEFAHLVDDNPLHTQEFAKLSGWKETVIGADGTILQPAKDANGIDRTGGWAEGDQQYGDGCRLDYTHDPNACFVGTDEAKVDPRDDYAESFRTFINRPEELLKSAPEKFLFLNEEAKTFNAAQVREMAEKAGVNLEQVLTNTLVEGRIYQPVLDRIAKHHGISGDKIKLMAKDQETLKRSANMQGLSEQIASSEVLQASSPETLARAEALAAQHRAQTAKGKTADAVQTRIAFSKLPFADQLRADPQIALGKSWHQFSAAEQAQLQKREFVDQLAASAAANPAPEAAGGSARDKAFDQVMGKLFDPSNEGWRFRQELGGINGYPQNPEAALRKAGLWDGLPADQQAYFKNPANFGTLNDIVTDNELVDAIFAIKEGSTGASATQTTLNKLQAADGAGFANVKAAFDQYKAQLNAMRTGIAGEGNNALDTAMSIINRQVHVGNAGFIDDLLGGPQPTDGVATKPLELREANHMSRLIGGHVWDGLTKAEQQYLLNPENRKTLVENARSNRTTGASLAEAARLYHTETQTLQGAFNALLRTDGEGYKFRTELKQDPVAALKKRGLWDDLPTDVQRRFQQNPQQVVKLVEAVQVSLTPVVTKQAGYETAERNLSQFVRQVNASNAEMLFNTLDLPTAEMQSAVKQSLDEVKGTGVLNPHGGNGA